VKAGICCVTKARADHLTPGAGGGQGVLLTANIYNLLDKVCVLSECSNIVTGLSG
jgi:hypothetical protein